jgi:hypothetical protein
MKSGPWLLALALLNACTSDPGDESNADEASTSEDEGAETSAADTSESDASAASTAESTDTVETADNDDTNPTSDTSDTSTTGNPDCTGPQVAVPMAGGAQPANPMTPDSPWPHFELTDFQPQSCLFGQTYSLESFKGRVTLLSLMRSTCEICQGTIGYLEQMKLQLELEGYEVYFVVINQPTYEASQQEFIDRASFPLLQDTLDVKAWDLLNQLEPLQGTDDIYIYRADGTLSSYFSYAANNPTIMLETQAGWDNVYNAILAAM